MKAGLRRPTRDAEQRGDPGERQIEIEVQDHDRTLLRFEPGERAIEQVAIGDRAGVIEHLGEVQWRELDLHDAPSSFARQIDAGVRHQAVQPVVEGRGITQPRQAAPGPDQRVLDGVLGEIRVTEDETSRGIQTRTGHANELGEGMPVASPCAVHEPELVHTRPSIVGATMVAVLDNLRRWRLPRRFRLGRRASLVAERSGMIGAMPEMPAATPSDPIVVVVALPDVPERIHMGELPANVDVCLIPPEPEPVPDLSEVDLIVATARTRALLLALLAGPPGRLRVVQTLTAGVDWLIGRVPENIVVCNARGVFDAPLAEWVIGAILAMQRGLVQARDAQARGTWDPFEPAELFGHRVVILGMGSIGSAIADRLRPFGVEVIGAGRTARDGVRALADLDDALRDADVLVNMLPVTGETIGLLDARRLGLLPDGALLVNGGRGPTIDTAALVDELRSGRIRAALDVTDPEPLPQDHPLWGLPNVLITPHIGGDTPGSSTRAFELAGDQVRRFATGEPLINQVARYLLD